MELAILSMRRTRHVPLVRLQKTRRLHSARTAL